MSFTDDVLRRYRRVPGTRFSPGTALIHKTARGYEASRRIDMQRQSGELLRMTRPKLLAENARAAAGLAATLKRSQSEFELKLRRVMTADADVRRLELLRFSRGLERYKRQFFDELNSERELIVKRALFSGADRKAGADGGSDDSGAAGSAVLTGLETRLLKKLDEAREELEARIRKAARGEAEAVLRGFREDEDYDRRRRGEKWR